MCKKIIVIFCLAVFLFSYAHAKVVGEKVSSQELNTDATVQQYFSKDAEVAEGSPNTTHPTNQLGTIGKVFNYDRWAYFGGFTCPSTNVTSAILQLYVVFNNNSSAPYICEAVSGSWIEFSITWNNKPGVRSGTSNTSNSPSGANTYSNFNCYNAIANICNYGNTNYGIRLSYASSEGDIKVNMDETTQGNRPNIDFVYEVDLSDFYALGTKDGIKVFWYTSKETDNLGWNLYRSEEKEGPYTQLNESIIPAYQYDYEYADTSAKPGKGYYYKLEDIDLSGEITSHGPVFGIWWEEETGASDTIPNDESEIITQAGQADEQYGVTCGF